MYPVVNISIEVLLSIFYLKGITIHKTLKQRGNLHEKVRENIDLVCHYSPASKVDRWKLGRVIGGRQIHNADKRIIFNGSDLYFSRRYWLADCKKCEQARTKG